MRLIILSALLLGFYSLSYADPETNKVVLEVQQGLKNPNTRKQMIDTPTAKKTEKYVKQISGGGKNEDDMYAIAADVVGNMKDMTPEQMDAYLKKAQENPEEFYKSLTPEQRKKIKNLSGKIPAANQKNP